MGLNNANFKRRVCLTLIFLLNIRNNLIFVEFKMKKTTTIIIFFLYMIPAIGLSMKYHYCGGKLDSVSIFFSDTPTCRCGKKVMKKNCCKDESTILKITDTQNYSNKIETTFSKKAKVLAQVFTVQNDHLTEINFEKKVRITNPPWQKSNPIYLLHQVFLI